MTYAYRTALLDALDRSGRSGRAVSLAAVGHESAVRSLRRGLDMRMSTIEALCRELDLALTIGPSCAAGVPPLPAPKPPLHGDAAAVAPPVNELERAAWCLYRLTLSRGGNPVPPERRREGGT